MLLLAHHRRVRQFTIEGVLLYLLPEDLTVSFPDNLSKIFELLLA